MASLFHSALRPALPPRENTLRPSLAALNGLKTRRNGQALAGRERQRVGNAAINADSRADIDRGLVLDLACEGTVPAGLVEGYRDVLDRAAKGTCIAELDPSDLRQSDQAPFRVETSRLDLSPLKAEAVVDATASRRRKAGSSGEEIAEGLVEVAQGLLLTSLRDGGDPVRLRSQGGQLASLRHVVQFRIRLTLILAPPLAPLLKRQIIDETANTGKLPEQNVLLQCRVKSVSEAAKQHIYVILVDPRRHNVEYRGGAPLSVIAECVKLQREGALPSKPKGRDLRA